MLPGPTNVSDRVMQAMLSPVINHRSHDFAELHKNVIEGCRYVFDTKKADVVVLSSSGTGGVDAAMQSILDPGDSVVYLLLESSHPDWGTRRGTWEQR